MAPTTKIIAIGNPGSGKSTFLNALAGEKLFKSGINIGTGLTYQLDEKINLKGHFLDTPGLADQRMREKAAAAISEGLRMGGPYKPIFFFTEAKGRVNAQDATTMKLVLDAAPEIGQNYGVIVNMVQNRVMQRLKTEEARMNFMTALFAGIHHKNCSFDQVMFFPELDSLNDDPDALASPEDLVSHNGVNLETYVEDYVPIVELKRENVSDIKADDFDALSAKLEEMVAEMNRRDDEFKRERMAMERQRMQMAEELRQKQKDFLEELREIQMNNMMQEEKRREQEWEKEKEWRREKERIEMEKRELEARMRENSNSAPACTIL